MERFRDVLLDVWREVCRHIEIDQSAGTIAAMLVRHLPLACLLVRRLDSVHAILEAVAVGQPAQEPFHATPKNSISATQLHRLNSWAKTRSVLHGNRAKRSGNLALMVPVEIEGEVLAGPMSGTDGPSGVLLLVAQHLKSFKPPH